MLRRRSRAVARIFAAHARQGDGHDHARHVDVADPRDRHAHAARRRRLLSERRHALRPSRRRQRALLAAHELRPARAAVPGRQDGASADQQPAARPLRGGQGRDRGARRRLCAASSARARASSPCCSAAATRTRTAGIAAPAADRAQAMGVAGAAPIGARRGRCGGGGRRQPAPVEKPGDAAEPRSSPVAERNLPRGETQLRQGPAEAPPRPRCGAEKAPVAVAALEPVAFGASEEMVIAPLPPRRPSHLGLADLPLPPSRPFGLVAQSDSFAVTPLRPGAGLAIASLIDATGSTAGAAGRGAPAQARASARLCAGDRAGAAAAEPAPPREAVVEATTGLRLTTLSKPSTSAFDIVGQRRRRRAGCRRPRSASRWCRLGSTAPISRR